MRFVWAYALDPRNSVKALTISKYAGKTINGICRYNDNPSFLQNFNCFPNLTWIGIVMVY